MKKSLRNIINQIHKLSEAELNASADEDMKKSGEIVDLLLASFRELKKLGAHPRQMTAAAVTKLVKPGDTRALTAILALSVAIIRLMESEDSKQITITT